jgi:hypothetical protein
MFEHGDGEPGGEHQISAARRDASVAQQALCRGAEVLVGLDWATLDSRELADSVAALGRVWRVVEAAVADGMAAMSRFGITDGVLGMPAASWWAHQRLGHGGQGAWLVRVGALIERFPVLGAAVRRGGLCLEHLRVLEEIHDDRVVARLTDLDEELCRIAGSVSLTSWRREVRRQVEGIRAELASRDTVADRDDAECGGAANGGEAEPPSASDRPPDADGPLEGGPSSEGTDVASEADGADAADGADGASLGWDGVGGAPDEGWLSLRTTAEAAMLLRGELMGHSAEIVRQLIAGELSRQRRAAWREHDTLGAPMPTAGQLRARALIRLLGDPPTGGAGVAAPARTEVVVVIEADDQRAERVRSLDGEPVGAELAGLLCCDAHLQALIVDQRGQPLWLGRSTRLASAAQRRALTVRDGGCVFPGCEMPPEWCDAHHEPGWTQGGRSDLEHMVLLCRRHHGAAHSRHWRLRPVDVDRVQARGGTSPPFEWLDCETGAVTPAQRPALRSPPAATAPKRTRDGPQRRCA